MLVSIQQVHCFSDLHVLDTHTGQWSGPPTQGPVPSARAGAHTLNHAVALPRICIQTRSPAQLMLLWLLFADSSAIPHTSATAAALLAMHILHRLWRSAFLPSPVIFCQQW